MYLKKLYHRITRPHYTPLNRIEIIRDALLANLALLQKIQPNANIFPVLKSNAYGHGLEQMCGILENTSVKMVVVDSFPEAQIVYEHSSKRVLLLGEAAPETYKYCLPQRTDFVVYNKETLQRLVSVHKNPRIHLFVNTGMNREGIQDISLFMKDAKELISKVRIVGLCSHLASAESASALNAVQMNRFFTALDILQKQHISPEYVHLGNSAGIFTLSANRLTAFRQGLALYGYNPFSEDHAMFSVASALKPALRVLSTIVSLQNVKKGEKVSYMEAFTAKKNTTIAVIPFGYFEGLDRRLSNKGVVKIHDSFCPIAGRISMNLTCLDVGDIPVHVGDIAEVISAEQGTLNSVNTTARLEGTIPYEVLVRLHGGIRRVVV